MVVIGFAKDSISFSNSNRQEGEGIGKMVTVLAGLKQGNILNGCFIDFFLLTFAFLIYENSVYYYHK